MFGYLGRLVAAHPWKVIAVWLAAFAVIVPFSPTLADVTNEDQTSFLPSTAESMQAQELAEEHFPAASGATARSSSRVPTAASFPLRIVTTSSAWPAAWRTRAFPA
jgi:hypothetical protein